MLADIEAALRSVPYMLELILTAITWGAALIFIRFNGRLFARVGEELAAQDITDRAVKRIDQLIDFVTVVVAVFVTLAIWGVDEMLYAALTTVGVIGIMLGFAVKDIASNFLSGILMVLSKDILVGDTIEVKGVEGTVEKINIRTSSIRRYDGALAIVPNSLMTNNVLVDFSATDKRRVEVPVVISSGVDLVRATQLLEQVAEKDARRLEDEDVTVVIKSFAASIVNLELRYWVKRAELTSAKSDAHERIQRAFAEHGLSLDVPTSIEFINAPDRI